MRLFIGIEFPDEILGELSKTLEHIRKNAKQGRVVAVDNLHLTLQFLGEVPQESIEPVAQAMSEAASVHSAFTLELDGVGGFGNGKPYRVLWVGVGGDKDKLGELQLSVVTSMARIGFPLETRPFKPHITLARDVELPADIQLTNFGEMIAKEQFKVQSFSLIESTLDKGKRVYRPLRTVSLVNDTELCKTF